jgi:IPT/TIG domain
LLFPLLTLLLEDNSFNSQPFYGKLEYTSPSWMSLYSLPYEAFDGYDWMTFSTYLVDVNSMSGMTNTLKCQTASRCYVTLSRSYTPQLYSLVPRVMHHGSEVDWVIDPRSVQEVKNAIELPFTSVTVGKQQMSFDDFSLFMNESSSMDTWTKNWVRSMAYQVEPSASQDVNFKFRAGNAFQRDASMIQCDITNTTCYKAKVVPVIESVSASSGFTTGGQLLEIDGYGFLSNNLNVKVDGVDCKVQSHTQT